MYSNTKVMATKIANLNMRIMGYLLITYVCWYFIVKYLLGASPLIMFPYALYYGALVLTFGYYKSYTQPEQTYYKAVLSSWITILFIFYICLAIGLYKIEVRFLAYIYGYVSMYLSNRFMNQTLAYTSNKHERAEIVSEYKDTIWYQAGFCLVLFIMTLHFNS